MRCNFFCVPEWFGGGLGRVKDQTTRTNRVWTTIIFASRFFCVTFFLRVEVGWAGWPGVVGGIKFLARSAGRQVIQKIKEKRTGVVWGRLGEGQGPNHAHRALLPPIIFALRFFLRVGMVCGRLGSGGGWCQVLSPAGGTPSHSKDQRQGGGLGWFGGG